MRYSKILRVATVICTVAINMGFAATNYYVASNGNDSNCGTLASPFKTIQQAANLAEAGDTVNIRGGVYRETVVPANSGAANNRITFKAYNGEEVTISGCDLLKDWKRHDGNIWKMPFECDLGVKGKGTTIFVNGELKHHARKFAQDNPLDLNEWGQVEKGNMRTDCIISDDIKGYGDDYWNGATVYHHINDWHIQKSVIADYDSKQGKITLAQPLAVIMQKRVLGFYIEHPTNTKMMLTKEHQWMCPEGEKAIYYYAGNGVDPNKDLDIEAKRRSYSFDLSGLDYITIEGLILRGTSIKTNSKTNYNMYRNLKMYGYDNDNDGVFVLNGSNNTLCDSEIFQTWNSAIYINGNSQRIVNNYFHHISFNAIPGVLTMTGEGHLVSRNTAHDMARTFTASIPQRCEFSYNHLYRGGRLSWDTGYFDADMAGGSGGSSIIHHNLLENTDVHGAYTGFYSGADITYHHNILIFTLPAEITHTSIHVSRKSFVKYIHNTIIGVAPELSSAQNILLNVTETAYNNNLLLSIDRMATIGVNCRGNCNYDKSDFANFSKHDFRLSPNSKAIDAGIVLPGFNDGYNGKAPDAGALEYGEPMFAVGHDFKNPPTPQYSWGTLPGTNLFSNSLFLYPLSNWECTKGTPQRFFGNAWNQAGSGLARLGLHSIELKPGEAMERTFANLKPNTWYAIGTETRLTDELIKAEKYTKTSAANIATARYRNGNYITSLANGDWVSYDNIDFGTAGQNKYDQLQLNFSHPAGSDKFSTEPASLEVRLDSPDGKLAAVFNIRSSVVDTWNVTEAPLAKGISGKHTIFLVAKGIDSNEVAKRVKSHLGEISGGGGSRISRVMISTVRFQNTNIANKDKLTIGIKDPNGEVTTSQVGDKMWTYDLEKFYFKTGKNSKSCQFFIENNGLYNAYFDQLFVYEKEPPRGDRKDLIFTDAIVKKSESKWHGEFVQAIDTGKIEITAGNDPSKPSLSNLKVALWDGSTSSDGGKIVWEKEFLKGKSLKVGKKIIINADEIGKDGFTRIGSTNFKRVVIERADAKALSLGSVSLFSLRNAPAKTNLAALGKASHIGDYYINTGYADTAINNTISPEFVFSSTTVCNNPWWRVELPEASCIDQIVIFNRTNAADRLGNFTVSLWDAQPDKGGTKLWSKDYSYYKGDLPAGKSLTINGNTVSAGKRLDSFKNGRVVMVQIKGKTLLSLPEVQVWKKTDNQ